MPCKSLSKLGTLISVVQMHIYPLKELWLGNIAKNYISLHIVVHHWPVSFSILRLEGKKAQSFSWSICIFLNGALF